MRISLCLNCLERNDVRPYSVGPDKGNQLDSYRTAIDLCKTCREALDTGDFAKLAERHTVERMIKK